MDPEPKKQIPPELRYYTVEDVAEMLQMSMSGVYDLMRKEKWPHSKYGSRIRFEYARPRGDKSHAQGRSSRATGEEYQDRNGDGAA